MFASLFKKEDEFDIEKFTDDAIKFAKTVDKQAMNCFIDGITGIWSGLDSLRKIKSRAEKEEAKEARENKEIDGTAGFIETEMKQ